MMLVLKINPGERVRIVTPQGEVIWVEVREDNGGKSGGHHQLAFDARRDVEIMREELLPIEQRYFRWRELKGRA